MTSQTTNSTRLEKEIDRICELSQKESLTLGELFSITVSQDQALITLTLSLPFLLPIPLPGLSVPFGLLICFISIRMLIGKSFWLPAFLLKKSVSPNLVFNVFSRLRPIAKKLANWVKPRGSFFSKHPSNKLFSFVFIMLCGILLALPLPPGTNAPPALAIVCLSLGLLEEDSLFLLLGYLWVLLILLFLIMAFCFGVWYFPAP